MAGNIRNAQYIFGNSWSGHGLSLLKTKIDTAKPYCRFAKKASNRNKQAPYRAQPQYGAHVTQRGNVSAYDPADRNQSVLPVFVVDLVHAHTFALAGTVDETVVTRVYASMQATGAGCRSEHHNVPSMSTIFGY